MNAVYYSLVLTSQPAVYQNQWVRSIGSLRKFNQTIPVHLFVYNDPTDVILRAAERHDVIMHRSGSYQGCLRELAGDPGAALSSIPTLNKLLPLGCFDASVSQLLFLDCDTFFFADVENIFSKYRLSQLYAREEPCSRRSVFHEYQPAHIDEDALHRVALETGSRFVPPYNSGVFLMNHGMHGDLFGLRKEFMDYAWRLTLGAVMSDGIDMPPDVKAAVARARPNDTADPIEFPSRNYWILEQIALWLTLGRQPDLTHDTLRMEDVLQNGEFMIYRSYPDKCTVAHYFSRNEVLFLKDAGIGES